jgi:hypothetical protein
MHDTKDIEASVYPTLGAIGTNPEEVHIAWYRN